MDRIQHLLNVYKSDIASENAIRNKIFTEEDGAFYFIPSFAFRNVIKALHAIYIDKNFKNARQYFFLAARVDEYMSMKFDRRIIDSGTFPISYALLSDNEAIIKRYAILKNSINDSTNIGYQLANAVQNILLSRFDALDINIRNLERFVKFSKFKWWSGSVEVFKGFKSSNINDIESGLLQMLNAHEKRNTDPLVPKFLSIDTAGYCKLAWYMGYKIDLKTDLVPVALMQAQPLLHYEEYDFLAD